MDLHTLTPGTISFLSGFLDIRFDALAEYVAETEGIDDVHDETVVGLARDVRAAVDAAARWAVVPARRRDQVMRTVATARRRWEHDGWGFLDVERSVRHVTSEELVPFVMREAYRDHVDAPVLAAMMQAKTPRFAVPPADVAMELATGPAPSQMAA